MGVCIINKVSQKRAVNRQVSILVVATKNSRVASATVSRVQSPDLYGNNVGARAGDVENDIEDVEMVLTNDPIYT